MSNRKTLAQKIETTLDEIKEKEAHYKQLLRQQKEADRKARNHRLCKRGGQVESLFPGLAMLTDEQFKDFVERCLNTSHTKRILSEFAPSETSQTDGGDTVTPPADTDARVEATPAPKPTQAAQNSGGNDNGRFAQAGERHGGAAATQSGNTIKAAG